MDYDKLMERIRCPQIQSCPMPGDYPSCSACQKTVKEDSIAAIETLRNRLRKYQSQRDQLQAGLRRAKKENRELMDYLAKLKTVTGVYCPKCGDALELEVINGEPAIGCFGCDEYRPVKEILSDAKMDGGANDAID